MNSMDYYAAMVEYGRSLFGSAESEELSRKICWTPLWSSVDVLAHLASTATATANGDLAGPPSSDWSNREVAQRVGRQPDDLFAEWEAAAQELSAQEHRSVPAPTLAWDAAVHLADISEFSGVSYECPGWEAVLSEAIQFRALTSGRQFEFVAGEKKWGDRAAVERVCMSSEYEAFRALFSRRSQDELDNYLVGGDPKVLLRIAYFRQDAVLAK